MSDTGTGGPVASDRYRTAVSGLGAILLNEQSLDDVMELVARLARDAADGADEVSVTLVRDDRAWTAAFTGQVAMDLDERQYEDGFGPCLSAAATGETVSIDDTSAETRYAGFAAAAAAAGVGSTFSVGLPVAQGTLGALNVYGGAPHAFDEDSRLQLLPFASAAAVALVNAALFADAVREAGQMREAMESRAVIEQAKGILVRDNHCTPDEAFGMLVKASTRSNRKLREIARALVESTARGA